MGRVGLDWVEIFQFLVGWVGSTMAKVLKVWKDYVNAFKARLHKIWLHQQLNLILEVGPLNTAGGLGSAV